MLTIREPQAVPSHEMDGRAGANSSGDLEPAMDFEAFVGACRAAPVLLVGLPPLFFNSAMVARSAQVRRWAQMCLLANLLIAKRGL
jgi:hypothetical protein